MNRRTLVPLVVVVSVLLTAGPALAGKGGNGTGPNSALPAACSYADGRVSASGLPTDEVINFMVSDSSGTDGWVLGFTDTGSWSEPVSAPSGPTTYEFVSRTWGKDGAHYTVFASCSA